MSDAEALRAAGESPVGNKSTVASSSSTGHGACDGEHLAHTRAALRSLVADHDDRTRRDRPGQDGVHGGALTVENPRPAREGEVAVDAGDLHDGPFRSERAVQDGDPAVGVNRLCEGVDDRTVGSGRVEVGKVLGHCLAGDGQAVSVYQALLQKCPQYDRHAADAIEVGHVVLAVRLHICKVRYFPARFGRSRLGRARRVPRWRWRAGGERHSSSLRAP